MAYDKTKPDSVTTWGGLYAILREHQDLIITHHAGASAPSSPDTGWIWFDTGNSILKIYNGTGWVSISTYLVEVAEVIAARGSKSTLDARLDVALNEDGTPKAGVTGGNEWVDPALSPVYLSASQFKVAGDHTDIYVINRRVKATITAGARYGTVFSASYSAPDTTVTLFEITDSAGASGSLDATLSAVEHAFLQPGAAGSDPRHPLLPAVANLASLPTVNLRDGDLAAVLSEDANYQWDDGDQAWMPVGRSQLFGYAANPPDLTIHVHHGIANINGVLVEKTSSATSSALTAPTVNPRIDLLVMDSAGALAWVAGAESASPVPPAYPADKMPIAEVYLRVGSTEINNTDSGADAYILRDVRPHLLFVPLTTGFSDLRNLVVEPNATNPTYQVDISCSVRLGGVERTVSKTLNMAITGVNGRESGYAEPASAWAHRHLIGKPDGTIDTLYSASATAPTLPAGYSWSMYIGSDYNNASSNIIMFAQFGGRMEFRYNTTDLRFLTTGAATSYTTVSPNVPATVRSIDMWVYSTGAATWSFSLDGATAWSAVTMTGASGALSQQQRQVLNSSRQIQYMRASGSASLSLDVTAIYFNL